MLVEFDRVGKRFGRVVALADVSLELPAGSRTALIGPNGSGKSTLVRSLTGMLMHDGAVRIDGVVVGEDRVAVARRIAYVPQIAPRLAAPVREVVRAVASLRGVPVAAIAAIANELDLDVEAIGKRPFRALSGGQRQKVLASLALAAGAELLVLDEPTASMDPTSRAAFLRLVDAQPATTTVLLCSHRLDEIRRLVDRVVVLEEGRVAWQGAAVDYLDAHAAAIVEVHVVSDRAGDWLLQRGFVRGATGWWSRSLPIGDRARVVAEIGRELNGQVRDVMARDVERLQPKRGIGS